MKYYMIKLISLLFFISFLTTSCNFFDKKVSNENNTLRNDYEQFTNIVDIFNNLYLPEKYTKITPSDNLLMKYATFPTELKLEKRNNDGVNGDPSLPTKYEFYFLNSDNTILVKVCLIYAKISQQGIISNSIISPADNSSIEEKYQELERPYIVSKLISSKDLLVTTELIYIKPSGSNKNDTILKLIQEDTCFYKNIEDFLINLK